MNKYMRVLKPIKVKIQTGWKHNNEYYGSAKILKPVYEELLLEEMDEVHLLQGGNFAVQVFNEGTMEHPEISYKVHRLAGNMDWVIEPEKILGSMMAVANHEIVDYAEVP